MNKVDESEQRLVQGIGEALNNGRLHPLRDLFLLPIRRHRDRPEMDCQKVYHLKNGQSTLLDYGVDFSTSPLGVRIIHGKEPIIPIADFPVTFSEAQQGANDDLVSVPVAILAGLSGIALTPNKAYKDIPIKKTFLRCLSQIATEGLLHDLYFNFDYSSLLEIRTEQVLTNKFIDIITYWLAPYSINIPHGDPLPYFFNTKPADLHLPLDLTQTNSAKKNLNIQFSKIPYFDERYKLCFLHEQEDIKLRLETLKNTLYKYYDSMLKNWSLIHEREGYYQKKIDTAIKILMPDEVRGSPEKNNIIETPAPAPSGNYFGKMGDQWVVWFKDILVYKGVSDLQGFNTVQELLGCPGEIRDVADLSLMLQESGRTYKVKGKEVPSLEVIQTMEKDAIEAFKQRYGERKKFDSKNEDAQYKFWCECFALLKAVWSFPIRRDYVREWALIAHQIKNLEIKIDPRTQNAYAEINKELTKAYQNDTSRKNATQSIRSGVEKIIPMLKEAGLGQYLEETLVLKTHGNDKPFLFDPSRAKQRDSMNLEWETGDII